MYNGTRGPVHITVRFHKPQMQSSERPEDNSQHQRWLWYVQAFELVKSKRFKALHSSHALLLEVDVQKAFCAGAWLSTIVLATAAIEANIRQIEKQNYETKVSLLFGSDPELRWLREIRNEIMHAGEPGSQSKLWKVDGHDISQTHHALEQDAKRVVKLMFRSIYG